MSSVPIKLFTFPVSYLGMILDIMERAAIIIVPFKMSTIGAEE